MTAEEYDIEDQSNQNELEDLNFKKMKERFFEEVEQSIPEISGLIIPGLDPALMQKTSIELDIRFEFLILKTPWEGMNYNHWDFGDSKEYRMLRITFTNQSPPISIYFRKNENILSLSKPTKKEYPQATLRQILEQTGFGENWFIVPEFAIQQLYAIREDYFPRHQPKKEKSKQYQQAVKQFLEQPTPKNTQAIEPVQASSHIPLRLDTPIDLIVKAWEEFRELDRRLLTEDDYQEYKGRKFKKKSAFRKYKLFYSISDKIIKEDSKFLEDGSFYTEIWVEAWKENRPNYKSEGIGIVHSKEKCLFEDKEMWDPATQTKKIRQKCPSTCNGLIHFSYSIHNIKTTAHTRAKNRAISDLIAGGEVSYEEIINY